MTRVKIEAIKEPVHYELSDWFYRSGNDVSSYERIAQKVKDIRLKYGLDLANEPVRQRHLGSWIAKCRFDMECRYRVTLYCVKGMGYKVATARELALYTARFARRTLLHADRTFRLCEIVDRKQMPAAIREVFYDQAGKIKSFKSGGRAFMETFKQFLIEESKKPKEITTNEKAKTNQRRNGSAIPVTA